MKNVRLLTALILATLVVNNDATAQIYPELAEAMNAVNALPTTAQCKSAIILLNVNAGGPACAQEWAKGRGTWLPGINAGKDGSSFPQRLSFLRTHGLPVPKHDVTKNTWRTPQSAAQSKGVAINNVPAKNAWTFCTARATAPTPAAVATAPTPEPTPAVVATAPTPTPAAVVATPAKPAEATTLQNAMTRVNALSGASAQCKSAIILLNVNAGGSGCDTQWKKGKDSWWKAISIGKDGSSFQQRLHFLKTHNLPIPLHDITQQTWRTPETARQNKGVAIHGTAAKDAWVY